MALAVSAFSIVFVPMFVFIQINRRSLVEDAQDREATERALEAVSRRASETENVDVSQVVRDELARLDSHSKAARALNALAERVKVVENRMPGRGTVDKLESVNDAIMATKIEALERDVQRLSENALTKWQVATIVSLVLAALAALVTILVGVSALF